jgi:hypothetical protein
MHIPPARFPPHIDPLALHSPLTQQPPLLQVLARQQDCPSSPQAVPGDPASGVLPPPGAPPLPEPASRSPPDWPAGPPASLAPGAPPLPERPPVAPLSPRTGSVPGSSEPPQPAAVSASARPSATAARPPNPAENRADERPWWSVSKMRDLQLDMAPPCDENEARDACAGGGAIHPAVSLVRGAPYLHHTKPRIAPAARHTA